MTRSRQGLLCDVLSMPKQPPPNHSRERRPPQTETRLSYSVPRDPEPELPAGRARYGRRGADFTGSPSSSATEEDSHYSETPFHERKAAGRLFDLPEYVTRERAIITAGRTFTWGGRQKHKMPKFDPDRDRLLSQT